MWPRIVVQPDWLLSIFYFLFFVHFLDCLFSGNQQNAPKTTKSGSHITRSKEPNPVPATRNKFDHPKVNPIQGYKTLPHPPYISDISPTDYHFLNYITTSREKSSTNKLQPICICNFDQLQNFRILNYRNNLVTFWQIV